MINRWLWVTATVWFGFGAFVIIYVLVRRYG